MIIPFVVFAVVLVGGIIFGGNNIKLFIDNQEVLRGSQPQLIQEEVFIPAIILEEEFGFEVVWNSEEKTLEIQTPYQKFFDGYGEKGMYIKQAEEVLPLLNTRQAAVLDVGSDEARDVRFIRGSLHIPVAELLERHYELPTDQIIAVYCAKNINASYAVAILNMLGYEAYLLEDGIEAWLRAGGRTSTCRV